VLREQERKKGKEGLRKLDQKRVVRRKDIKKRKEKRKVCRRIKTVSSNTPTNDTINREIKSKVDG